MRWRPACTFPQAGYPIAACPKALDLLDEACARARFPTISAPADLSAGLVVTAHTVAEVLSGWVCVLAEGVLEGG